MGGWVEGVHRPHWVFEKWKFANSKLQPRRIQEECGSTFSNPIHSHSPQPLSLRLDFLRGNRSPTWPAPRDSRDLTTTGWYMGALASGSAVVVSKVWPAVLHGTDQQVLAAVWAVITLSMVCLH